MLTTNKIKVNKVRVGDPHLFVELQTEDTGTFPRFVQVLATVTLPNSTTQASANGTASSANGSTDVTVQCSFTDGTFAPNQTFQYNITAVQFSNDGSNWTPYTGAQDGSWSGSVTSTNVPGAVKRDATPPAGQVNGSPSIWDRILLFFRSLFS